MITIPDVPDAWPPPPVIVGGLHFKDVAPMISGVVDNGVCPDDPRVIIRLNEATKIVLDAMIPVGGMMTVNVFSIEGFPRLLILPPQMENIIEAHPLATARATFYGGNSDIQNSWYEITSNSTYLEPEQQMDNPLIDLGIIPNPADPSDLRRAYFLPGMEPGNATVQCTGAKRYMPIRNGEDYLIVQNVEALKYIILSIERSENNAIEDATKYRETGLGLLQQELKKHLLDPRFYALRKANYYQDIQNFAQNTLGWIRAQMALDFPQALRAGKRDLAWTINQAERRLMERGPWKDTIVTISARVVGGIIYMPQSVESVLAIDLNGCPIPIRSQFFQHLENGPGGFPGHSMLIDQGNHKQPGFDEPRRKYKLVADCEEGSCIVAVCKLRWRMKEASDMMVIKNYEALRLMTVAKFLEEAENWKDAVANQQSAFDILEKELRGYLAGILHTVHVQTVGFGLGDVGRNY